MPNQAISSVSIFRISGFVFFMLVFVARCQLMSVPGWAIGISALIAGVSLIAGV